MNRYVGSKKENFTEIKGQNHYLSYSDSLFGDRLGTCYRFPVFQEFPKKLLFFLKVFGHPATREETWIFTFWL